MNHITWIIHLEAKADQKDAMLELVSMIVDGVAKEKGNLSVRVLQDQNNPLKVTLVENWQSKEDHEKFLAKVSEQGILEKASHVLARSFEGNYYDELPF